MFNSRLLLKNCARTSALWGFYVSILAKSSFALETVKSSSNDLPRPTEVINSLMHCLTEACDATNPHSPLIETFMVKWNKESVRRQIRISELSEQTEACFSTQEFAKLNLKKQPLLSELTSHRAAQSSLAATPLFLRRLLFGELLDTAIHIAESATVRQRCAVTTSDIAFEDAHAGCWIKEPGGSIRIWLNNEDRYLHQGVMQTLVWIYLDIISPLLLETAQHHGQQLMVMGLNQLHEHTVALRTSFIKDLGPLSDSTREFSRRFVQDRSFVNAGLFSRSFAQFYCSASSRSKLQEKLPTTSKTLKDSPFISLFGPAWFEKSL
jgi:hypothetical protein